MPCENRSDVRIVVTLAIVLMAAASCGDSGKSPSGEGRADSDGDSERSGAAAVSYPDSTEGLERLIRDILGALENGKKAEAQKLTKSLELVDPEVWFAETFGADRGEKLASAYAPVAGHLSQMSALFERLLENHQTHLEVERFVHPDDPDLNGYQSVALGAMKHPSALYSVRLSKRGDARGFHLWSFVHSNGSFRWVGKMKQLPELTDKRFEWISSLPSNVDPLELRLRESNTLVKK